MSRNAAASRSKPDRRVRSTRDRLGDALVALMLEKPFDAIRVQDVLDRAGVGRSTFYAHYRDKNDLFLSDIEEFLEETATLPSRRKDTSDRVAPVAEFFAHVGDWHRLHAALVASERIHDFLELARGHFARAIAQRLRELPRGRGIPAARRAAVAHAQSGALLSLLSWWIDRDRLESPAQMDELFHRMFWSGVEGAREGARA
jgi:AcrR family transcriptional regulator